MAALAGSRGRGRIVVVLSLALAAGAAQAQFAQSDPRRPAPPASSSSGQGRVVLLDRVVAVVNDEAVTQFDIDEQKRVVLSQMHAQNVPVPPGDALDRQILERLINERVLLQTAKESGVRVDDVTVERTIERIAQENKLSPDEFRKTLAKEGIDYPKYREDVRREIVLQRLRERDVDARIQVTDAEVDNFLASQNAQAGGDVEYRLAHILVLVPERATADQIEARRQRAEEALRQVRAGSDFAQVAAGYSDAPDALQGGSLGWRAPARLPTVFADPVRTLAPGQTSDVLRSAAGFHILRLLEKRSRNAPTVVEQTHVRHILIKVNEITSEADARVRIDRIRERVVNGAKFEDQARLNSEDASSSKGGDLGWISPGDTVTEFEQALGKLQPGEISPPVRSPFGWHLVQVLERRTQDVSKERQRDQARLALRQRKSDEAYQDWMRQMRDRAYVEVKTDE